MAERSPPPEKLVDLRVAHLNMIQGVISRMSGFSASAKNFCITINAAVIAVGFQKQVPWLGAGALMVGVLFCLMDSYYLSLERRYRALYEDVATRPLNAQPNMSLKASTPTWGCFGGSILSVSVFPFYLLLMASIAGLLYLASHVGPEPVKGAPVSDRGAVGEAKRPELARVTARPGVDGRGQTEASAERAREPVLDANTNSTSTGEPVRPR